MDFMAENCHQITFIFSFEKKTTPIDEITALLGINHPDLKSADLLWWLFPDKLISDISFAPDGWLDWCAATVIITGYGPKLIP